MTEILPQINEEIKMLMIEKNLAFKLYCCSNRNMFLFEIFVALTLIRLGFLNVVFPGGRINLTPFHISRRTYSISI